MFRNRQAAAHELAVALKAQPFTRPVVLAIPRGGLVLGEVLARELEAEFDILLARNIRAPNASELVIGAVAEGGGSWWDDDRIEALGVSDDYIHQQTQTQLAAIRQWQRLVRGVRPPADLCGRSVLVTDDGIATGATMIAALEVVRQRHPAEVIVAVPVLPADRTHDIRLHCDRVVNLLSAAHFSSVGQFYEEFPTVSDEEAVALIRKSVAPSL
jgi:predicted phosphoribosyltransferase